jgi:hypothetical protein
MTDTYINTTVETSAAGVDAFDMDGQGDSLLLANTGSLIALGANSFGLFMDAAHETATLDGMVYSAHADGVDDAPASYDSTFIVNGEVDAVVGDGIGSYADGDSILVSGSVYGGDEGLFMQGSSSSAVVNGTASGSLFGIQASGNNEDVHVNGTVDAIGSGGFGIQMLGANQTLDIGVRGDVFGGFGGVNMQGMNQFVRNAGHISVLWDDGGTGLAVSNEGSIAGLLLTNSANTTIENAGLISTLNQGIAIDIAMQSGGTSVENSGAIHGSLDCDATSTVVVENSGSLNGQVVILSSGNSVTNSGGISKGVIFGSATIATSGNVVINDGTIHGSVSFFAESGTASGDSVTNAGTIDGGIVFNTAYGIQGNDTLTNSGTINGGVTMGINETLTNAGTIHGNVYFATESGIKSSDVFDNSNGIVIGSINGGSSDDTFIIGHGSNIYNPSGISDDFDFGTTFGNDVINGFKTGSGHDVISFSGGDFTSFAELETHMTQVGKNTVITLEPGSSIELTHTTMTHLVAADFIFG